jgi:uncharacterized protein HemX
MPDSTETPLEQLTRADSTKGPAIATIIIIVVLIMGAVVVFYRQYQDSRAWQAELAADSQETGPADPNQAEFQSTASTSLESIESDLETADLSDLMSDVEALETDL